MTQSVSDIIDRLTAAAVLSKANLAKMPNAVSVVLLVLPEMVGRTFGCDDIPNKESGHISELEPAFIFLACVGIISLMEKGEYTPTAPSNN